MKKCYSCEAEMKNPDVFCMACGTKYVKPAPVEDNKCSCMECGADLPTGAMFCLQCGTKTAAVADGVEGAEKELAATVSYEPPKPFSGYSPTVSEAEGVQKSLYIIEFIKSLTKDHNIPVLIYLLINVLFICLLLGNPLVGIVVYLISLCVALSPIGERILRWQTGCKKIKRPELTARIEPLFNEAKRRAKAEAQKEGLCIPEDISLFVNGEKSPNAFATGRKTICFTEGLLTLPDDQVIATLTHEFGHIAHHDTDMILLVSVGNLIVSAIITAIKLMVMAFNFMIGLVGIVMGGAEGVIGHMMTALGAMLSMLFINGLMWVWTQFGNLLVMKSMRSQEYRADEFAYHCGYGNSLCALLNFFDGMSDPAMKPKGLFATLYSTHPENNDRITKLQNIGCTYHDTTNYGSK